MENYKKKTLLNKKKELMNDQGNFNWGLCSSVAHNLSNKPIIPLLNSKTYALGMCIFFEMLYPLIFLACLQKPCLYNQSPLICHLFITSY